MLRYGKHVIFAAGVIYSLVKADELIKGEGLLNSILLIIVFFVSLVLAYDLFYEGWDNKNKDE